jgi:hypothetical protein
MRTGLVGIIPKGKHFLYVSANNDLCAFAHPARFSFFDPYAHIRPMVKADPKAFGHLKREEA